MKIKYEFATKETVEIEVDEKLGAVSIELDRQTKNSDRRETRRHSSFEQAAERLDTEVADERVDIEKDYIESEQLNILRAAIKTLTPEQQELVRKVFFKGQALKELAAESGVSYQAIQNRLNKILEKLRKKL